MFARGILIEKVIDVCNLFQYHDRKKQLQKRDESPVYCSNIYPFNTLQPL